MKLIFSVVCFFTVLASLSSCKYYRQDILINADSSYNWSNLTLNKANAEKNYVINKNDWIEVQVYSNKGESILDPNSDFQSQVGSGTAVRDKFFEPGLSNLGTDNTSQRGRFLVGLDGCVVIPVIGKVKLENLTYRQADSLLNIKFSETYQDAYVVTRATNRRVYFIASSSVNMQSGASSFSKVIPLLNENTNLLELIAMAGGLPVYSKASSIFIIRGDIKKPQIQKVDLTSINGIMKADLKILPNDIIYIEPGRRMIFDTTRDLLPLFTAIISISSIFITTVFLITK